MTITEDDLIAELQQLHKMGHPERQEGEFTVQEYAEANNMTNLKAGKELYYLLKRGKVEKPPLRFIDGKFRTVYKTKAPPELQ